MAWITPEAESLFGDVILHLLCALAFALAPWYAASYDTDKQEMYNLLAPPGYVFSTCIILLPSVSNAFSRQHPPQMDGFIDRIMDFPRIGILLSLLALVGCVALFIHLLLFMLLGSLRMYLAPIALTLMWFKSIPYYNERDDGFQPGPNNAIDAIKLEMDKLSLRVWFTWLTGAMIFSFIDIVQFFYGEYFSFAVYANLMGVLVAVAVALYIASRDPVVAWVATWFVVGLAMRKAELKGDAKETVETLQTVASAIVPIFAIVLLVDTTQGFYDFFVKFIARSDASPADEGRNAAHRAVRNTGSIVRADRR